MLRAHLDVDIPLSPTCTLDSGTLLWWRKYGGAMITNSVLLSFNFNMNITIYAFISAMHISIRRWASKRSTASPTLKDTYSWVSSA